MKGQTEVVTAVMITGVVVGAAASAYVWGAPLIDKRQSQANLNTVESKVLEIEDTIGEVANGGEGNSDSVSINLENGQIYVNESGNYLDVEYISEGGLYSTNSWQMLRGSERQGLSFGGGQYAFEGEDEPGIVAATQEPGGSLITFRAEFRNMRSTTPSGEVLNYIDIQPDGAKKSSGDVTVYISNEGTESEEFTLDTGETIRRRSTKLNVDLR